MGRYLLKSPPTAVATYPSRYSSTLLQLLIPDFYYLPVSVFSESSGGYVSWPMWPVDGDKAGDLAEALAILKNPCCDLPAIT